ncbi:hypothetical protein SM007_28245 [Streptomyces avermitilis]|uniref:Uncharacterized protein n=2 Tax=Streptomyces avermitilis TaxID=33903 RepID=A0A4D4MHJ3_STRAX|nr:hypothetical protein SM007_28245 [Streptomyces avermitilis]GDY70727.1 hypothetical protein SAV31267_002120 [Streptomyces avermitilis]
MLLPDKLCHARPFDVTDDWPSRIVGHHSRRQRTTRAPGRALRQLLCENQRENCIPIALKFAPKKGGDMFKALGIPPTYTPDPLPRSFSPAEAGRIERVMRGEPEPPTDSNTGGAGWIVEAGQPDVLRTLCMDFKAGIDDYFPDTIATLTDHEIRELEARHLWFAWTEPLRPGESGPEPSDDEDDGAPRRAAASAAAGAEGPSPPRPGRLAPPGTGGRQKPHPHLTGLTAGSGPT